MKKIVLVLIISFSFLGLFSQYNEKEIMMKRARRLEFRRNYDKAMNIYKSLLERNNSDKEIIERIIRIHIIQNDIEKAEEMLSKKKKVFSKFEYTEFKLKILLREGQRDEARELANKYIKNDKNITHIRKIARIFSSYKEYTEAIKLYEKIRKITNDPNIYAMDMARNYQYNNQLDKAIIEYLKKVTKNNSYKHYVFNRIKKILDKDADKITVIEKYLDNSENEIVRGVYAKSLAYIGKIDDALLIFDKLGPKSLLKFSEEQFAQKKYNHALTGFQMYVKKDVPEFKKADAFINIAKIMIKMNKLEKAENILQSVRNNETIQKGRYKYRTRANKKSRILLAEVALRKGNKDSEVINYLEEAYRFAFNKKDQKKIRFELINFYILKNKNEEANNLLDKVLKNEEPGSEISYLSNYYKFLLSKMNNDAKADSFVGELVIHLPKNEYTNDVLRLNRISDKLSEDNKSKFWDAFKKYNTYQESLALTKMDSLIEKSKNENIRLLAAEWAIAKKDTARTLEYLNHDFKNKDIYAQAQLLKVENNVVNEDEINNIITDYLTKNPNTPYAPEFRKFIKE